jgi:uncharacterized protein (DUF2141 family)
VKHVFRPLLIIIFSSIIFSCARKSRPEGGPKDETPPLMVTAEPPYESIRFNKENIKISFNEYIVLKDLTKQLVVSPPLKYPLSITPQGTPSKFININILDTLTKSTTYIFNFGDAIRDNNEANKLERFKYVFSTGNYIDSLLFKGNTKDAFIQKAEKNINVLLYRIDSSYTDSLIYKQKPNYVTNTSDTTNFQFSNLKKGKYFLFALKDTGNDYLFNPKTDKIAFLLDTITLPQDSILKNTLVLFKERRDYTFKRGKETTKGRILFGYEGDGKDLKVELLSNVKDDFKSISKFEQGKDTLNYWFTPIEADSLNFIVTNKDIIDTVTVKLRKKKTDSLTIKPSITGSFHFRDTFFFKSNNPIIKLDTSKIFITDKDTIAVPFKSLISATKNQIAVLFEKKPKQQYSFTALPNAFSDIFSFQNDSLQYNLRTKELEDYGEITLDVQNINSKNLIVELLNDKGKLIERQFLSDSKIIVFKLLEPKTYKIRAIIDENKNNKWDTGNFLEKKLPESVIYYSNELSVRANYFLNEVFTVNK